MHGESYAERMLCPEFPVHTDRLALRPFQADDLDALYAIQSRADVTRFLYWDSRDREQANESLHRKMAQTRLEDEGQALACAVVWREVDAVVGDVHLEWRSREHRQGEIGFVFHPDCQGKGLAREAAEVMLRLGFAELGLHRIEGRLDARNTASAALLERLGMRREAHFVHNEIFKGEWGEELVYAMLDDEWAAR